MSPVETRPPPNTREEPGPGHAAAWDPLREPVFRAIWIASVVSNVGTWMQNVGGAWLMVSLTPSPLLVALMQTATSLPVFLIGLPAGALADLVDRRRLLLFTQTWMLVCAGVLGGMTLVGLTTPWVLLTLTFLLGLGATANSPAWQATTPEVVSRRRLPAAIALNSAGFNLARAVGPALGGIVVAAFGPAANFLLNALSFLATIVVLYRWRREPQATSLPAERPMAAVRTGLRYARHAPELRAVLVRTAAFIVCASALWALLPLVARDELALDASGYGLLVGSLGVGAVGGALLYPRLRVHWSTDRLVAIATGLLAAGLLALAWVRVVPLVCLVLAISGVGWMASTSSFQIAVQTGTPEWVRARAIGTYLLVFQGGLAIGSVVWGMVAERLADPLTLSVAVVGLVASLAANRHWSIRDVSEREIRPSTHWPRLEPEIAPAPDKGPVLVTAEYRVDPGNATAFVEAMRDLERVRRRDGAYRWGLYRDPDDPRRFLETFLVESWAEHMRQHERVIWSDRAVEQRAFSLAEGGAATAISHLVAAEVGDDLSPDGQSDR